MATIESDLGQTPGTENGGNATASANASSVGNDHSSDTRGIKDEDDDDIDVLDKASITKNNNNKKSTKKKGGINLKLFGSPSADTGADNPESAEAKIWSGLDGMLVTLFGIVLPVVALFYFVSHFPSRLTMMFLNHPIETAVEMLLVLNVPFANYKLWKYFTKRDHRYSLKRGCLMGAAIGTSLLVVALGIYATVSPYVRLNYEFAPKITDILVIFTGALLSSSYIVARFLRTRDFKASRHKLLSLTACGTGLSLLAVAAAETKPAMVKLAEQKAVSMSAKNREAGLRDLRNLNPERELLVECSTPEAFGLSGLLLPVKSGSLHQLYFALTGRPFDFKDIKNQDLSSMPDDYLSRNVVGDKVVGLEMIRSTVSGKLHPSSFSSTVEWTFVFRNNTDSNQEARAEVSLPPGSVVTNFTMWKQGNPNSSLFAPAGDQTNWRQGGAQMYQEGDKRVTDLGQNRVLLSFDSIPAEEEIKAKVTIAMPLRPDGVTSTKLDLPRMIAENFDLGEENALRLISANDIRASVANLKSTKTADGTHVLAGSLTRSQMENADVLVTASRTNSVIPTVVLDKQAMLLKRADDRLTERKSVDGMQVEKMDLETLSICINGSRSIKKQLQEIDEALAARHRYKKVPGYNPAKKAQPRWLATDLSHIKAVAPANFVVVVDASSYLNQSKKEIVSALKKIPASISTNVILVDESNSNCQATTVQEALKRINDSTFRGGQDNLKAVVKASELAGETKSGAVLWLHGPQPHLNREIYIMAPYVQTPNFYDIQLGSGQVDTTDYFRNNKEVGPFVAIPRSSSSVAEDFGAFVSRWTSDKNYTVQMTEIGKLPTQAQVVTGEQADELLALHAAQDVQELCKTHHFRKATREALAYGIVSQVSNAVLSAETAQNRDIDDVAKQNESESRENNTVDSVLFARAARVPSAEAQAVASDAFSSAGPQLQGATNGTVGPQGTDATFITGVNTAGTVRVNNLANIEALLNIAANGAEIIGLLGGLVFVLRSIFAAKSEFSVLGAKFSMSRFQLATLGICAALGGLAVPGMVDWLVSSARDANLFS